MKSVSVITMVAAAFLIAGCNNKQAEDTAAIRAMMEKQQADAKVAEQRGAAFDKAAKDSLKAR